MFAREIPLKCKYAYVSNGRRTMLTVLNLHFILFSCNLFELDDTQIQCKYITNATYTCKYITNATILVQNTYVFEMLIELATKTVV